jgi:hypothetical protein
VFSPAEKCASTWGKNMAVSAVGNQSTDPNIQADYQSKANSSSGHHERSRRAERESDQKSGDGNESRYRPSSASENPDGSSEAGGTYQISQFQVFSASATLLLAQTGSPTQTPTATVSGATGTQDTANPVATNPATGNSTTATTSAATASGGASQAAASPAATTTTAAPETVTPASTGSTAQSASGTSASAASPLQGLNSVLQALGLSQQDIQAFDQVASLIQSLSPAAYADLVNVFQTLAQQIAQASQSAPSASSNTASSAATPVSDPTASATTAAATTPAATTPAATSAASTPAAATTPSASGAPASGGIQVDELSIRFSALEIQGTIGNPSGTSSTSNANPSSGSSGSTGGTFDLTAFQLNVNEVSVTLPDANAPASSVQAPPIAAQTSVNPPTGTTSTAVPAAA